jgi:hypothetical protein
MTAECATCAERGYDNTDYHRLHRAWCDSVAEIERLRAALKPFVENYEINLPEVSAYDDDDTLEVPIVDLRRAREALK